MVHKISIYKLEINNTTAVRIIEIEQNITGGVRNLQRNYHRLHALTYVLLHYKAPTVFVAHHRFQNLAFVLD